MSNGNPLSEDIIGAVIGFTIRLNKGLIEHEDWDWSDEVYDWNKYQECYAYPTVIRTTLSVYLNNLRIDENGEILNYDEASFRGFQYFRSCVETNYCSSAGVEFEDWELIEPNWYEWE